MKKFIYGLLIIILILVVLLFAWPQLYFAPYLKWYLYSNPYLKLVPENRYITSTNIQSKDFGVLSYGNIIFKVPWKETPVKTGKDSIFILTYNGDRKVVISPQNIISKLINTTDVNGVAGLITLFGSEDVFKSEYTFTKTITDSVPDEFSIFNSQNELKKIGVLQLLKSTAIWSGGDPEEGFYNYQGGKLHIIQIGRPNESEEFNSVALIIFDASGKESYRLLLRGVSQKELDFILSSIEPKL